jgi:hypothetical protein
MGSGKSSSELSQFEKVLDLAIGNNPLAEPEKSGPRLERD